MIKRFFKWIKKSSADLGIIECTKDFVSEGNEYINEKNGWEKVPTEYIDIDMEDKDEKERKTHKRS